MTASVLSFPHNPNGKMTKQEYVAHMKQVWARMGMITKAPVVRLPQPKVKYVPPITVIEPVLAVVTPTEVEKNRVKTVLEQAAKQTKLSPKRRIFRGDKALFEMGEFTEAPFRKPRSGEVIGLVANFFGVTSEEILSGCRRQRITMARHVTFFIMRRVGQCSYPQIAKAFGYDHTTILSGVDRIERLINQDEDIRFAVTSLSRYLVEAINGTAERPNHFWGS